MLLLIELIVGLILLILPLLHPLTVLLQQLFSYIYSTGTRVYSFLTLRNNKRKIMSMQISLVFGYAIILFLDTIAASQASMLLINLKFYYGSAFSITPSQRALSDVTSLLSSFQSDPQMQGLEYGFISTPLEQSPTLLSIGRIQEYPLRL